VLFEGSGETFGHSLETRIVRVSGDRKKKKDDLLRNYGLIQNTLFFMSDPKALNKIVAGYNSYSLVYTITYFQVAEH